MRFLLNATRSPYCKERKWQNGILSFTCLATLAQPVEQYFRKVEVPGSIPGGGSILIFDESEVNFESNGYYSNDESVSGCEGKIQ